MKVISKDIHRDDNGQPFRIEFRFEHPQIHDDEDDHRSIVRSDGCTELFATCFHWCEEDDVGAFGAFLAGLRAEGFRELGI